MMPLNKLQKSAGFTLIEVLVAMLVFAIGMLGLAALQIRALQDNQDAYLYTQAVFQAYDLSDRIRANPDFWAAKVTEDSANGAAALSAVQTAAGVDTEASHDFCSTDDPAAGTSPGTMPDGCTVTEMAEYDLYRWFTDSQKILPGLTVSLLRVTDPNDALKKILRLSLSWSMSNAGLGSMNNPSYSLDIRP